MRLPVAVALLLSACNAPGVPLSPDAPTPAPTPAPQPATTVNACGDAGPRSPAGCSPLTLRIATAESCAISITDCAPQDAEVLVPYFCPVLEPPDCPERASRGPQRVITFSRLGRGHVLAHCDSTTAAELFTLPPLTAYLAQTAQPRLATLGDFWPCVANVNDEIPGATHLGATLPPWYADGAALARDWDIVVVCARSAVAAADANWAPVLQSYVRDQGKGIAVLMDYASSTTDAGFAVANALVAPAGVRFDAVDDGYSVADVELCLP